MCIRDSLCVLGTLVFLDPILHLFTQDQALLDTARGFARIAIFAVPFMACLLYTSRCV